MKKQLGIIILMLCAVVLQAQQMTSPSYMTAINEGATTKEVMVYRRLYKSLGEKPASKFFRIMSKGFWRFLGNTPSRDELSLNKVFISATKGVNGPVYEAHHVGRLIDMAIEEDNSKALRAIAIFPMDEAVWNPIAKRRVNKTWNGKAPVALDKKWRARVKEEFRKITKPFRFQWQDYTITYPDGKQEKVVISDFFKKAVELKSKRCLQFFLTKDTEIRAKVTKNVPASMIKEAEELVAQLEREMKAQAEAEKREMESYVKKDLQQKKNGKKSAKTK